MMRILIFGDSITYGAFDSEAGGWADRLKAFFFREGRDGDYFAYNLGVSGDTTEELLKRFEFETKLRTKEKDEKEIIFIFEVGINDSSFSKSKKGNRVEPEKFRQNIKKLIRLANKFSPKIIFVGAAPVDESKTKPIPWNRDITYTNHSIQNYNQIIEQICEENKIHFIELFGKLTNADLEDGCHPNSRGHQKIFIAVKDFLVKNKIISAKK